jgi:hypothetical protein
MTPLSLLWRCGLICGSLGVFAVSISAQTSEVYFRASDGNATPHLVEMRLEAAPATPLPAPRGTLPVLFVHGHNTDSDTDNDRNYRKNWQDSLRGLTSFMQTLDLAKNSWMNIEDYYVRFANQGHSIHLDALDIREAVDLILHRHDPNYSYPHVPGETTNVKVVIIAYSKGTISSRLYLKNLLADPNYGFNPISEFIAVAPPNHGVRVPLPTTCAAQQLANGRTPACNTIPNIFIQAADCEDPFPDGGTDFIKNLNEVPGSNPVVIDEAPGSRSDSSSGVPNPPTAGTLYVTVFDGQDRDLVGGQTDPVACQSRPMARNRNPNAVNIASSGITDDGWQTVPTFFGLASDSEKQSIAVHQNTVHTPEVICSALYAAVHHRSPQGLTCSTADITVAGVPEPVHVPVIPRAAVMLALDFSGSMGLRVCAQPGCQTRAEVLQDAVDLFVNLWMATGDAVNRPGDRLGATYFSTNVTWFPVVPPANGGGLVLLDDGTNVSGDVLIRGPNNMTAMGAGLQQAINVLKEVRARPPISRVILFTDGLQNVNPMVQMSGNQLVIANDGNPSRPTSNIPPANPNTVLDQSSGIAIDTIGIGAADPALLSDIATATNGIARTTIDANMLNQFFTEVLIDTLRGSSPQLVSYRRGVVAPQNSKEAFAIENGVRRLILMVNWKRGNSLDFSVHKDGVDVTNAGRFINGAASKIFVINLPAKGSIGAHGNWEIRIKGKATTKYEAAAIVDGSPISYVARFEEKRPVSKQTMNLVVRLTSAGRPIDKNVTVTATLVSPAITAGDIIAKNPVKKLLAAEPGLSLAQRQLLALTQDAKRLAAFKTTQQKLTLRSDDKGDFRAQIKPSIPGIYTAFITIDGDVRGLGPFSRTQTLTTVVRFANADARLSKIFRNSGKVEEGRAVRITFTPRDADGHLMGPGRSSDISVQISEGRMAGEVRDLGDGTYVVTVQPFAGKNPSVKLDVAGGTVFSGRLSEMPKR